MGLSLEKVVPWGRSYEEYLAMFALDAHDLGLRILGCGDGPAAFNADLNKQASSVVSLDPLYVFDTAQIRQRITETYATVMAQMQQNQADYAWTQISSLEQLANTRMDAMEKFLADFALGKQQGRYITGELPHLPFESNSFDLVLCSHFLFLYSAHLSEAFHLQAIEDMLRVAKEVRIFPLLTLDGTKSPYLKTVMEHFAAQGFRVFVQQVAYEFQRGANEMLRIKAI